MDWFDQLVQNRRSIRKYREAVPAEEMVRQMIACAAMAPSPSNSQPVRFVRIASETVRQRLQKSVEEGYRTFLKHNRDGDNNKRLRNRINVYQRYSDFIFSAPLLFAVGFITGHRGFSRILFEAGILETDARGAVDLDISVGLALQGFLLKAETLGIGTCIVSAPLVFASNVESILGLPDMHVRCLLTAGYPDETPFHIERLGVDQMYRVIS